MVSFEKLKAFFTKLLTETGVKIDTNTSDIAKETTQQQVLSTTQSIDNKITKVDTDNVKVISEPAYDNANDRKKVSIENDTVGLAKETTLQSIDSKMAYDGENDARKVLIISSSIMVPVDIQGATIQVPVDVQAIYREKIAETTTPLDANGEYTGDAFDALKFASITGIVYADVDGTLYIEHSMDGVNWDYAETTNITGGSGAVFQTIPYARYVRIRYVNGATAQTVFRLQAWANVR